jgi:hypothetical protein
MTSLSTSKSDSAVCDTFKPLRQAEHLQRPPTWPRNPQHVARAASHRKAGYFARKLIKLSEMDLLPFEIVAAAFPHFSNVPHGNALDVVQAVNEATSNFDRIYLETADPKLQRNIEQAKIVFEWCLDYMTSRPAVPTSNFSI